MLLALALVVLAIVVQMAVTMVLHGQVESIDVIRSIFRRIPAPLRKFRCCVLCISRR
ncbi:hypothetical protein OFO68_14345 [Escherichia coli]|nr:hypothetical protein [Escherichia coli]